MSVQSKPFYWLACDAPDCGAVSPDEGYEVSAWETEESAVYAAGEEDWLIVNGKHICTEHIYEYCAACGERLTEDERGEGEYTCFKCAPELQEVSDGQG